MIEEQRVVITLKPGADGTVDISMVFEPGLCDDTSTARDALTESDSRLQAYADHIGAAVMQSLRAHRV